MKKKYLVPLALSNTVIEWTEYMIYLYLSATISRLFFPQLSNQLALLVTFAIFGVSHLSMPIGAMILGRLSDRIGRKPPLIISIFLMGFATLSIGLLPTYGTIGILAPILLLVFRMLQGIAVGGEYNSAVIYLIEHSKKNKPLAGCAADFAVLIGITIGGFAAVLVEASELESAWRIPYIITGLISLVLCIFRRKLIETPIFLQQQQQNTISQRPLMEAFHKTHHFALIKIACIGAFLFASTYICVAYYVTFLNQQIQIPLESAQIMMLTFNFSTGIAALFIATRIKTHHAISYILCVGIALMCIGATLLYQIKLVTYLPFLYTILGIYGAGKSLMLASFAYYMYTLLPSKVRCSGTSVSWTIAVGLSGGTATVIAAFLVDRGYFAWPGVYVAMLGVLAISFILLPQKDWTNSEQLSKIYPHA